MAGMIRAHPTWAIGLSGLALSAIFLVALRLVEVPVRPLGASYYNLILFLGAWLPVTAILAGWALFKERPPSPFGYLRQHYFTRAYWIRQLKFLPIAASLALFMVCFGAMKSAIPLFNAYSWDEPFIAWDRMIFFGQDPWRLLQPVLGYPIVSALMSGLYHLWILLIYAGCVYIGAHQPNDQLRLRYFVSYFLCWSVIGVVMAIWFASVGPAFMEELFGDNTFEPLMDYLRGANEQYPILVLAVQQQLLDWHATGDFGLGRGISAMPSMHVSLSVLFWLGMREISRPGGLFSGFMPG